MAIVTVWGDNAPPHHAVLACHTGRVLLRFLGFVYVRNALAHVEGGVLHILQTFYLDA